MGKRKDIERLFNGRHLDREAEIMAERVLPLAHTMIMR